MDAATVTMDRPVTGAREWTPTRSLDQRKQALGKANDVRSYRARLKRDVKAGRKSVLVALDDPMCATMKVWDLLMCVPKYGRVKVNRALRSVRMSPSKTCGGLSDRQRGELRSYLAR